MKKRLKIDGFLSATLAIMLVILARIFYRPKPQALDYALDILGMLIVVFGQVLRISGRNYKKQYSDQGGSLITDGPYALVRNPMYLGTFLMGAGYIIILWPWWFLFIYILIFYLRFHKLMLSEEDKLSKAFGQSYQQYLQTAPRLIPSFAKLFNLPKYLPLKWEWIKKELSVIFTWFILVVIIEGLVEKQSFVSPEYVKEIMVLNITFLVAFGFFLLLLLKNGAAKNS